MNRYGDYMLWLDTSSNVIKIRSDSQKEWTSLGDILELIDALIDALGAAK